MTLKTNTKIALLAGALLGMVGYDAEGTRGPDYIDSGANAQSIGSRVEGCEELWKNIRAEWRDLIKMEGHGYIPESHIIADLERIDPALLSREPNIVDLNFRCDLPPRDLASYIKLWEFSLGERKSLLVVFKPWFIQNVNVLRENETGCYLAGDSCFVVMDDSKFFHAYVILNRHFGSTVIDIADEDLLALRSIEILRNVMDDDFVRGGFDGKELEIASQLRSAPDCVRALEKLHSRKTNWECNYGRLVKILEKLAEIGVIAPEGPWNELDTYLRGLLSDGSGFDSDEED